MSRLHRFYALWAPFYDWAAGPAFEGFRREAVRELALEPGHRLYIPGVGTGLDFPFLPAGIEVEGTDLSEAMLERGRLRAERCGVRARLTAADAEEAPFPDASFDRAYLPCIVCVADRGDRVLREALRVVKPGGRVVVIDKFLGEGRSPGLLRRALNAVSSALVTHVNRRWSEVSAGVSGFSLLEEKPGPLGGFFRMFVLKKSG